MSKEIKTALENCFISPNESDSNAEAANVVDGLFAIARALNNVSKAIHKLGVNDASTPMGAIEALAKVIEDKDFS